MYRKVKSAILTIMISLLLSCCGIENQQELSQKTAGSDDIEPESAMNNTKTVPYIDEHGFTHAIAMDSPGEVKVFAFSEGQNYQKVLDRFYEVTKDTLQTKLTFSFSDDIKKEQLLQLSSKEDFDLIFDAFWLNASKNLENGMYADLTDYFNNPDYPGLQAAFPEELLDSLKYTDGRIYGIPYYTSFNNLNCIYYREDWREELGLPEIVDEDTFYQYLQELEEHAEELGILSPMGLGERGWFYFGCQNAWMLEDHIYEVDGTGARATQNMYVLLNKDNTKVLDAAMVGDVNHDFSLWPDGENPFNRRIIELGNRWSCFVNRDTAGNTNAFGQFCQGKFGAYESSGGGISWVERMIKANIPKAEVGCYVYDDSVRNREKLSYEISFANNYMYVPYYCDDIDRTMAVVDWVFESQANNDLFSLGIEGDDWQPVGGKQFRAIRENDSLYSFPTWLWSQTPVYNRIDADESGMSVKYMEYVADIDNFISHPFAGMSFNKTGIEVERAALVSLQEEYYHQFMIGSYGEDTEAVLEEFGSRAGEYIEVMRVAVMDQVQEYIDNKQDMEIRKTEIPTDP